MQNYYLIARNEAVIMNHKTVHIALVDDHKILLDGIEALLSTHDHIHIVCKAESGADLLNQAELTSIDLLVLDINMKGKDGIQFYKEISDQGYTGKCIFLSSYDDLKLVNEAIDLGAHAYVTKANATANLENAIEQVLAGEIYYSPDIKEKILRAFSKTGKKAPKDKNNQNLMRLLTKREMEVLQLIAQEFTSEEIAQKLFIAKSTVDTHRKNLIHKLNVKNAVGLGLFAERHGLI